MRPVLSEPQKGNSRRKLQDSQSFNIQNGISMYICYMLVHFPVFIGREIVGR